MKKIIIISLIAVALIVVGYMAYKNAQKKKEEESNTTYDENGNLVPRMNIVANASSPSQGFPIVYQKFNENAKALQRALGVDADGIIGPVTLKEWQRYQAGITPSYVIKDQIALNTIIANISAQKAGSSVGVGGNWSDYSYPMI